MIEAGDTAEFENKLARAQNLLELGDYEQAAHLYVELATENPNSLASLSGLALTASGLGQHRDAERLALRALELDPKHVDMWLLLAGLHEAADELESAIQDYKACLAVDPNNAEAHLHMGRCLTLEGSHNEGLRHLRRATSLEPQSVNAHYALGLAYHANKMPGAALESFVRTIEVNPFFLDGYLTIADLLAENRRWAKARNILLQAESLFSDSTLVLDKLAAVFLRMGEVDEALKRVERQAEIEKDNIRPYLNLSTLAQLAEDWNIAWVAANALVEKAPEYWESHYHLGSVLDVLDQTDEAKTAYRKAIELAPEEWRPLNNLAYLLNDQQTPGSWSEAERLLEKAIELAPEDEPLPHYNLALSLVNLGKDTEALKQCLKILDFLSPEHSLWEEVKRLHQALQEDAAHGSKLLLSE